MRLGLGGEYGVSSAGYDDLNRLVNWNPAVGRGVTYSFQRDLARLGIEAELRRAGIVAGDLVRIGGTELEWEYDRWEDD